MTEVEILAHLRTKVFGRILFAFDSLDSTNLRAKSLAAQGAGSGTVVIADQQTAGRGRLGRTWSSEKGENLTFSIILRPTIPAESASVISMYAALAVAEAIESETGMRPECKWPNDVLLGGKKFCGILSEATLNEHRLLSVVVGIGINVNQLSFPSEILQRTTSLRLAKDRTFDRYAVLASVLARLELLYSKLEASRLDEILHSWMQFTTMFGTQVTVDRQGQILRGVATRLADDGGLIIQAEGKEFKVLAGDVTLTP